MQTITQDQIEQIKYKYAFSRSYSHVAKETGLNRATVRKYVGLHMDDINILRQEKAPEIIDLMQAVQVRLIEEMLDEDKIKKTELADIAKSLGIVTDKLQLISGKATTRTEHASYDLSRLSEAERTSLAELRQKMLVDGDASES